MNRTLRILAICILSTGIAAFAHGNMDHIIGTVKRVSGNVVTVEKDGMSTDVSLSTTTTFETGGKPGRLADLRVGDRVVIHAVKMNGKETAHEVRYAHPGGAK